MTENIEQQEAETFGDELGDEALDRPTDASVPFTVGSTHAG
jgi:hypothetical protein